MKITTVGLDLAKNVFQVHPHWAIETDWTVAGLSGVCYFDAFALFQGPQEPQPGSAFQYGPFVFVGRGTYRHYFDLVPHAAPDAQARCRASLPTSSR